MTLAVAEMVIDDAGLRSNQRAFLEALAESGSITDACERVGMGRTSHYDWLASEGYRDEDQAPEGSYTYAFVRVKKARADQIREISEGNAMTGAGMPAVIERIFHIKRWFPQYRDQVQVNHAGTVLQAHIDLTSMAPADRVALLQLAAAAQSRQLPPPSGTDT